MSAHSKSGTFSEMKKEMKQVMENENENETENERENETIKKCSIFVSLSNSRCKSFSTNIKTYHFMFTIHKICKSR